jgi:DNA-binding CsgD family transcriptional regulator
MLEASRDAVIVCDRLRQPFFANERAQRLLDEGDGLGIGAGGLIATTSDDTRKLRTAIEQATRPGTVRISLPRRSGRLPLMLRIVPAGHLGSGSGPVTVAIFIGQPDRVPPVDREAIADVFGLTPRETAVAASLADGRRLGTIAAELGIDVVSVRSYLKRAFHKTGAHSQAALVALLRGFV